MDENSDVRAAQADGQGEKKGGGAGIILVILIVLIAVAVFFATQKKGPQMGTVMEIIPQQCVTFMQVDLDKAEEKDLREKLWNKMKESPEFQKALEEMKTKDNVDVEKDVLPWIGNQVTMSVMEAPKAPKTPGEKPAPEKFVLIFSIKDQEAAKTKVKEITGKEQYTEEKYGDVDIMVPSASKPNAPAIAFVKGMLVLGDKVDDVKAVIDTASGKSKSIKENAAFMETVRKLPPDSMGMFFVEMGAIAQAGIDSMPPSANNPANEEVKKVLKSMKSLGMGVAMKDGNIVASGFMGIDKATDSVIMKTVLEKKPSLGDPASLKLFPSDTSYYGAMDVTYIYDIILKVVALQPNGQQQFDTGMEQFKSQTGIDLQKDIIDNLSGEMAYTLDFTELIQAQMGGKRQPPPVVLAIKVKDKAKMKDVLDKLTAKAGPMLAKSDYNGVTLYSIPQGGGTFGLYEDFFLLGLSTGGSKVNVIIDNKMDAAKSMASLEGYKLIKSKLNDKTISVGMVKFEKLLPIMELGMAAGAAKDPKQAAAAKTIMEYMKKYGEIWSVSEVGPDGIKFDVVAIKSKEEPKK